MSLFFEYIRTNKYTQVHTLTRYNYLLHTHFTIVS